MSVLDQVLVEMLFLQKSFQGDPAGASAAISLGAHVECIDGMDFPKGGALGISRNGLAALARRVAGIEQELAGNPHRQSLFGHDVDVIRGPGSGTMVWDHFRNDAGTLICLRRRVHDGNVDVVIRGDISDIRAAVDTLRTLLARRQDKTNKADLSAFPQGLERFAIGGRARLTGNRMIVGVAKRNGGILLDLGLKIEEFWNGNWICRVSGTKVVFRLVLKGFRTAVSRKRA